MGQWSGPCPKAGTRDQTPVPDDSDKKFIFFISDYDIIIILTSKIYFRGGRLKMNDIKWIFFDLGSTLVDESAVYESRCDYAVKQAGISRDEFMEKVYEAARTSPTPIKSVAQYYNVILPEWDNSPEKLFTASENVVEQLSHRYKLGIIANQTPGTQERIDNWGIGKYFDVVAASAEVGCAKPEPAIFNTALKKAGCAPENAVMIGDRLDNDIAPAKQLGMKTIWVRQELAKYQNIDNENERPDYTVDDIADILNILM